MQKRKPGNRDLEVSALGLGCMRMTFGDKPVGTRHNMIEFIHAAVDRGITYLMGLAALPLADIEAIRFSTPLMITILSVVMLGEKVNLRRWLALIVSFAGVLIVW